MADFEDSLRSALDYESEVAYITLTSPVSGKPASQDDSDEFDFNTTDISPTRSDKKEEGRGKGQVEGARKEQEVDEEGKGEVKLVLRPPVMNKESSARPQEKSGEKLNEINTSPFLRSKPQRSPAKNSPVSPLTLSVPHYTLDTETELPSTPRSKLRRIKDAQAPPSPHPHLKLAQSHHLYCIMVVYGSSGCGRTHLVEKLVHSNPSLFAKVVSSTTRRRRQNEVSGVDFHYISHREMSQGISRGDFIESVRVFKKRGTGKSGKSTEFRKRFPAPEKSVLPNTPSPPTTPATHPTPPATPPTKDKKYASVFDLTAEDSPSMGGEMFGTTHQALSAATQQGKPGILLNVSTRGAQQLKNSELAASYILVKSNSAQGTRHGSRIERSEDAIREETSLTPDHIITSDSLDQAYSDLLQYALQLVGTLKSSLTSQYHVAQYEWEALPTVQFEEAHSAPHKKLAEVTFSELLAHFQNADLKPQLQRAKAEQAKTPFTLTRLSKRLQSEKLLVQAVSYLQLSDKERIHSRMLQTIYSQLTGNTLTCRRIGAHWQEIGFTGVDPADDLHTVGLLGLTQLISFLDNSRTAHFCKEIFRYCHRDTHVIPFVVLAFEFTQLSLDALDNGCLNKLCNKRDQVFVPVNEFYMAAFHHYYQMWRSSQKSILQLGLLMQQCSDHCKAHPRQVLEEFDKHLSIREPQNQLLPALLPKAENSFTPFDNITTT